MTDIMIIIMIMILALVSGLYLYFRQRS